MGSGQKPHPPYVPRPSPIAEPRELREYSREHVAYEVDMFFGAIRSKRANIRASAIHDVASCIANAVTEAFALHVRNLIEFLYPDAWGRPSRATDVLAHYFISSFDAWTKARPPLSPTLERAKIRADKEMAHLTTQRAPGIPSIRLGTS